jgi:hypothetical protein
MEAGLKRQVSVLYLVPDVSTSQPPGLSIHPLAQFVLYIDLSNISTPPLSNCAICSLRFGKESLTLCFKASPALRPQTSHCGAAITANHAMEARHLLFPTRVAFGGSGE